MALFKSKNSSSPSNLVSKSQLIETLLKTMEGDYPHWKVIESNEETYDLLLIRNVKKTTTRYIKSKIPDPFHDGKEEIVQIVLAVFFSPKEKNKDRKEEDSVPFRHWTKNYIITSTVKGVLSVLETIDEEENAAS